MSRQLKYIKIICKIQLNIERFVKKSGFIMVFLKFTVEIIKKNFVYPVDKILCNHVNSVQIKGKR